jgi:abortive infection bacteriophage resistance protein
MAKVFKKAPTTVDEQIELLTRRGMEVCSRAHAKRCLETIGYYRLSAYWHPYKATRSADEDSRFRPGTKFSDIYDIYVFDAKLRLLLIEAIGRVEIHVRSCWTTHIVQKHGAHAHLDHRFFSNGLKHAEQLWRLANAVDKSKETFVQHYKKKYAAPYSLPLWAATELMSMGELSKWVSITKCPQLRGRVARDVGFPSKEILEAVLQNLAYIRNVCAHHARLWNRRLVKRLPIIKQLGAEIEVEEGHGQRKAVNLIYNVFVVLLDFLRGHHPESLFQKELRSLIDRISEEQRRWMGFPKDWRDRTTWVGESRSPGPGIARGGSIELMPTHTSS